MSVSMRQGCSRRRKDLVVHKVVDSIDLANQISWVEVKGGGSWQVDTVQHAHDVAALIADQLPCAFVHQQWSCAAPSVPGTGCIIHLPATQHCLKSSTSVQTSESVHVANRSQHHRLQCLEVV